MSNPIIYESTDGASIVILSCVSPLKSVMLRYKHIFVRNGDISFKHLTPNNRPNQIMHQWQWKIVEGEFIKAGYPVSYTEPTLIPYSKGEWTPAIFTIKNDEDQFRFILKYGSYIETVWDTSL